jgi:hypothetical protein
VSGEVQAPVRDLTLPERMRRLPTDKHGRPIPWFVHIDAAGVPDFRVIRRDGIPDAYRFAWCWVCGQPRGQHAAFVIGPMCAVNRVSAEPPSHLDCALYSARACPFLSTPNMVRRERGLDLIEGGIRDPAGKMIPRNPGVAVVWSAKTWKPFAAPGGALFNVGEPTQITWWAHGRPATRDEVLASIDSGLPLLQQEAARQGKPALDQLDREHQRALRLLPPPAVATGGDVR